MKYDERRARLLQRAKFCQENDKFAVFRLKNSLFDLVLAGKLRERTCLPRCPLYRVGHFNARYPGSAIPTKVELCTTFMFCAVSSADPGSFLSLLNPDGGRAQIIYPSLPYPTHPHLFIYFCNRVRQSRVSPQDSLASLPTAGYYHRSVT